MSNLGGFFTFEWLENLYLDDDEAVEVLKTLTLSLHKKRFVAYGGIFKTIKQELKLTIKYVLFDKIEDMILLQTYNKQYLLI